jgi:hypothetical protein
LRLAMRYFTPSMVRKAMRMGAVAHAASSSDNAHSRLTSFLVAG